MVCKAISEARVEAAKLRQMQRKFLHRFGAAVFTFSYAPQLFFAHSPFANHMVGDGPVASTSRLTRLGAGAIVSLPGRRLAFVRQLDGLR